MLFTQNIDCLEREAGVPGDLIVEAHGSFATQRCIDCKKEFPDDTMKKHVLSGKVPHCVDNETCNGLVKPDIVFFGEALPSAFFHNLPVMEEADLALVMGTSLTVHPFAGLPERVEDSCPRVLFNMERVGSLGSRPDDVLALGDCDANVCTLADELGWLDELYKLWEETVGEAETERQLKGIRDRKKMMLNEMEELTKKIGAGLTLDDNADENEPSADDDVTDKRALLVASAEDREGASSESVSDRPDDTTASPSRSRDATVAAQITESGVDTEQSTAEVAPVNASNPETEADQLPVDAPEVKADTKDSSSSALTSDVDNKEVQAKDKSAPDSEAIKGDESKAKKDPLNKSVL